VEAELLMKNFFNNIRILIECYAFFLTHGFAVKKNDNPKTVVIIQMAKLGDMVCTTPMFRAVKNRFPESKLIIVGNAFNREILSGNNDVDDYFVWDKNVVSLVHFLKKLKPEFLCITSPNATALAGSYIAGVQNIATPIVKGGFCPTQTKLYRLLSFLVKKVPHYMGQYAPGEYLRLLEVVDIYTNDTTKYLSFSKESEENVCKFLHEHSLSANDLIVGIAPAAGNKIKQWPPERFGEVADYLIEKHKAKIVLIGGPQDISEEGDMISSMRFGELVVLSAGKFSVDELKALVSKLSFFVAVDTGPIYIAEAFGTPTIDIIGPIDENEQPPVGKNHLRVLSPYRKKPIMHVMNSRIFNVSNAKKAVLDITVDQVISEVKKLIFNER